jgi:3-oxoacyl-[acyl-carrier protein] reductase
VLPGLTVYYFGVHLGLRGRAAIVTGGSQGIGRAIAFALAAEGANLTICSRREGPLRSTAEELRSAGADVVALAVDVTDTGTAGKLVDATVGHFGRLDILVNNAGKGHPKPVLKQDHDDWLEALELNLLSAVALSNACIPHMRQQGWGRIVNISSRVAREPDPYFAPYSAAKAGLMSYTKSLAEAFSKDGVLVNCVVPGLIRSEAVDQAAEKSAAATGQSAEDVMKEMRRRRPIPAGRLGEPEDVAGMVTMLCSEAASWVTGGCFNVDGGMTRSWT